MTVGSRLWLGVHRTPYVMSASFWPAARGVLVSADSSGLLIRFLQVGVWWAPPLMVGGALASTIPPSLQRRGRRLHPDLP
ncbi:hypothetical protein GCM10022252_09680 [Streptosporangium oxazolinicum]|uniref:Uncharacterized protein n=1 Tax=Streptosporangium oxazolinicum TaxID=909287 RepID=A0ABP8AFI3_9ACTN